MIQKFISKCSNKEKKLLVITIIVVVLTSFWSLYIGPGINKLFSIKDKIISQKNSIKRDLRILSYKDRILKEAATFDKYFTKKAEEKDVINADFLSAIEKIATKDNINLVKSNPSNSEEKKNFTAYYANLDCMGKLENIINFMYDINTTDGLLKVVQFNMTPKRGTEDEVKVSMTIMKMVMIYDEKEAPSQ